MEIMFEGSTINTYWDFGLSRLEHFSHAAALQPQCKVFNPKAGYFTESSADNLSYLYFCYFAVQLIYIVLSVICSSGSPQRVMDQRSIGSASSANQVSDKRTSNSPARAAACSSASMNGSEDEENQNPAEKLK